MKMKRFLAMLLAICLTLGALPVHAAGETVSAALSLGDNQVQFPAGEWVSVSFTPAESGEYWISQPADAPFVPGKISGLESYDHYDDQNSYGYVYQLNQGTSYTIELYCAEAVTGTVTVTKVENAEEVTVSAGTVGYLGDTCGAQLNFPEGTVDCVDVAFSDPSVAELAYPVDSRDNYNNVTIRLLKVGSTTVTATTRGGATVSWDLTVYDSVDGGALPLDTPVDPADGTTRTEYTFSPNETGLYWVTFPAGTDYSWSHSGGYTDFFHYSSSQYTGEVCGMVAGETYTIRVSNISDDNAQLKVMKTQLATGISWDQTSVSVL